MRRNSALFSDFCKLAKVAAGNFAKAASVGANTVIGPGLVKMLLKPAVCTKLLKVFKLLFEAIVAATVAVALSLEALLLLFNAFLAAAVIAALAAWSSLLKLLLPVLLAVLLLPVGAVRLVKLLEFELELV